MHTKAIISSIALAMLFITLMSSCKKNTAPADIIPTGSDIELTEQEILDKVLNLPSTPLNYSNITLPPYLNTSGMRSFDNTPANNPITDDGATLGRVLFYDKALSINNTTACASCHKQANGFADPKPFSSGFAKNTTRRNSMSLVNTRYSEHGTFFWDQRVASLEELVLHPIQDPIEMGMTLEELEIKLAKQDYYKVLFKRAFGDTEISRDKISLALAQFVRTLISFNSKFDEGMATPPMQNGGFVNFTLEENNGMRLFQTHCGRCHGTPLQLAPHAENNGLDLVYADNGLGEVTNNAADNGKFKTPSLRNVAVTAPYMHDGRFANLAEVVEHYNSGVQNHPNAHKSLLTLGANSQPKQLNLTQVQKDELIAFLHTLTDEDFLLDVRFSDPFKK